MGDTPRQLGFRMPAEWEPHAATWLTWPRPDGVSFLGKYFTVPPVLARFIQQLIQVEPVHLNVWDIEMESWVRGLLTSRGVPLDRVQFHHFPAREPWCRDHGPIFLVREQDGLRERAVVDWAYNAAGGRFLPFDLDDVIPQHVAADRQLPLYSVNVVLEGGAIDVNGCGSLLTTESCLLNPNRNPLLRKWQVEQHLRDYLGVTEIVWLGEGLAGDERDGHVDSVARFVDPLTIVVVTDPDPASPNHRPFEDNLRRLQAARAPTGEAFNIVPLPMPGPVEHLGQRLPASYANFYIANRKVLVPTFRHPNDEEALDVLRQVFPGRRVIGIDSTDLIWGLGSFHSLSQQEPA